MTDTYQQLAVLETIQLRHQYFTICILIYIECSIGPAGAQGSVGLPGEKGEKGSIGQTGPQGKQTLW